MNIEIAQDDLLPVSNARSSDLEIACFAARKANGARERLVRRTSQRIGMSHRSSR